MNAQVLIGGTASDNPHAGAILDLASGGQNNLGLLLPNVQLSSDASEFVLASEATVDEDIKQEAAGMIVYNTTGKPAGPGLYVWNGAAWLSISNTCPHIIKDVEGHAYFTGWFGAAGCWMTQNLRSAYNDIMTLSENAHVTGNSDKYYYYPNADKKTYEENPDYGLLYTWAAATGRTGADSDPADADPEGHPYQGICPSGWHVPSDKEWNDLEKEIAESAQGVYSTAPVDMQWKDQTCRKAVNFRANHGRKVKSTTRINASAPRTNGASHANDENGFDALLVGWVEKGSSYLYGNNACFWSGSSSQSDFAWSRNLNHNNTGMSRQNGSEKFSMLFSVRCKKD
jgi:uncharacterized protein (TIGR02145 family)